MTYDLAAPGSFEQHLAIDRLHFLLAWCFSLTRRGRFAFLRTTLALKDRLTRATCFGQTQVNRDAAVSNDATARSDAKATLLTSISKSGQIEPEESSSVSKPVYLLLGSAGLLLV